MKRKFISALLFGALCLTPASVFVSCSDYDADIENLQQQITANATSLDELVKEKFSNVELEIESLKSAKEALEAAYKEADEETKKASIAAAQALVEAATADLNAALEAAGERIDGQEKTIAALLAADADLQTGIAAAKEKATQAYALAEQAKALAEENQAKIAAVAEDLKKIKETLEGQINALGDDVKKLTERIGKMESALTAQEASLKEYIDEQDGKIDDKVKAINATIDSLKKVVTDNKAELEKLIADEVKALEGKISAANASIDEVKTAYAAADRALQTQIDGLDAKVDDVENDINALDSRIEAVEGLVNVLFVNLANLITGVIVQDAISEFEAVYAKVTDFNTNPAEAGKTYVGKEGLVDYVYFPYKNAAGAEKLIQQQYNVERMAGNIYATINPNTVDFNGQKLSLLNSKDEANREYQLDKAKTAEGKLISRAASKNGLYEIPVVNVFNEQRDVMKAPATDDKVLYALAATDNTTKGKDGKPIGRKVYSRYEIEVNAKIATALTNADFELVGKGATAGDDSVYNYLFSEEAASAGDLGGTLQLKPVFEEHKAKGAQKVYRKYLICTDASKPSGTTSAAERNAAVNAMNGNEGFKEVLAEGTDRFNEIGVAISAQYNGWIFTYDYYIWNYNGSIYKNTYKVIYTKPMIETQSITMTHTPNSSKSQVVTESNPKFSELLCMAAENKKWVDNVKTVSVGAVTDESGVRVSGNEFSAITFTDAKDKNEQKVALTNNAATGVALIAANVKKLSLTYNPAAIALGKVYTVPVKFYNAQGNMVNTVNILFTMNRPEKYDGFIQRIAAAFDGDLTIAWADYDANHPGYAFYNMSGSYNNVGKDLNTPVLTGAESKILFKDMTVYNQANKNKAYKPVLTTNWQYANPFEFNEKIAVPIAAIDRSSKVAGAEDYEYNLEAGVKYFGLGNLYAATENFRLKWYSPIYHAPFQLTKDLVIGYPGVMDMTNTSIKSTDPSKSGENLISYLANRDYRIAKVEIKPIMNGSIFADSNTGLFTKYEVSADGTKISFETTEKAALQGTPTVNFHLVVTDVFGCVKTHTIPVKVIPNSSNAPKK